MAWLNKVMLIGNLTREPELRYTPSGTAVADLGMAVNREWTDRDGEKRSETCFVDVVAWRRQAEICDKFLTKGSLVYVEGRLQLDTWETPQGEKRSRYRVVAERVQFLDRRERQPKTPSPQEPPPVPPSPQERGPEPPPETKSEPEKNAGDFPF
jgi:single-strand DNA-binding protein